MSFAGKEIDSLGQVELEIRNEGSDVVKDATISVSLPAKCKVLSTLIEPQELGARSMVDKNVIYIVLPYVNPYDVHKQTIKTSMLIDGDAFSIKTTGTGEGWSLRYSALPTEKQTRRRLRIAMGVLGTWLIALFPYGRFLERKFGLSAYELSWRSLFLNAVPNLLALMLVLALAGLFPSKSLRTKG